VWSGREKALPEVKPRENPRIMVTLITMHTKAMGTRESPNRALKSNSMGQRILSSTLTLIRFGSARNSPRCVLCKMQVYPQICK